MFHFLCTCQDTLECSIAPWEVNYVILKHTLVLGVKLLTLICDSPSYKEVLAPLKYNLQKWVLQYDLHREHVCYCILGSQNRQKSVSFKHTSENAIVTITQSCHNIFQDLLCTAEKMSCMVATPRSSLCLKQKPKSISFYEPKIDVMYVVRIIIIIIIMLAIFPNQI